MEQPPPAAAEEAAIPGRVLDHMNSHLDLSSGQNVGSNETSLDDTDSQFASPPEDQDCQKPAHVKATPPVDPEGNATDDPTSEHSEGFSIEMDSPLDSSSGLNVGSNETSLDDSQFASPPEEQDCQKPALVKAAPSVEPSKKRTRSASPGSSTPGSYKSRRNDATEGPTSEDQGTDSVSPDDNPYMKALENMWAKRKEAEALKAKWRKERHDEIMALEKKKLELEEKELDLQQWIQDNKVMSMDMSSMSEQQQQYYTRLQEKIFARRFGVGSS